MQQLTARLHFLLKTTNADMKFTGILFSCVRVYVHVCCGGVGVVATSLLVVESISCFSGAEEGASKGLNQ